MESLDYLLASCTTKLTEVSSESILRAAYSICLFFPLRCSLENSMLDSHKFVPHVGLPCAQICTAVSMAFSIEISEDHSQVSWIWDLLIIISFTFACLLFQGRNACKP